jgi:hypothetical protein
VALVAARPALPQHRRVGHGGGRRVDQDRGIQLFGRARELRGRAAEDAARLYARRFPDARDLDVDAYRYYRLSTRRMKLFHERRFGGATFVTARVGRDGALVWVTTERYV